MADDNPRRGRSNKRPFKRSQKQKSRKRKGKEPASDGPERAPRREDRKKVRKPRDAKLNLDTTGGVIRVRTHAPLYVPADAKAKKAEAMGMLRSRMERMRRESARLIAEDIAGAWSRIRWVEIPVDVIPEVEGAVDRIWHRTPGMGDTFRSCRVKTFLKWVVDEPRFRELRARTGVPDYALRALGHRLYDFHDKDSAVIDAITLTCAFRMEMSEAALNELVKSCAHYTNGYLSTYGEDNAIRMRGFRVESPDGDFVKGQFPYAECEIQYNVNQFTHGERKRYLRFFLPADMVTKLDRVAGRGGRLYVSECGKDVLPNYRDLDMSKFYTAGRLFHQVAYIEEGMFIGSSQVMQVLVFPTIMGYDAAVSADMSVLRSVGESGPGRMDGGVMFWAHPLLMLLLSFFRTPEGGVFVSNAYGDYAPLSLVSLCKRMNMYYDHANEHEKRITRNTWLLVMRTIQARFGTGVLDYAGHDYAGALLHHMLGDELTDDELSYIHRIR